MGDLAGKSALVTGGSAGIGLSIAQALAAGGAQVAIAGRRQEAIDTALASLGPAAKGFACDVTRLADLKAMFGQLKAAGRGLDVLVLSAGSTGGGPLESCTEEAFDALMALNVKSVFFTVQQALPLLNEGASLILIGSVCDTITLPGGGVYSASKAALRAFVATWANDLAPRGVRVNLLSPGITETPLLDRLQATPESMARFDGLIANRTALKRRGRPQEIADVAAFLASDRSSYMTGGVIYVDGGMSTW
jgi:NAD(P)-dependent dehydrogenase (short-subunit alcohol dehydrogenase family)